MARVPSPYSVITFRGGSANVILSDKVPALLQARQSGGMVMVETTEGEVAIDTVSIDQIAEFGAWIDGMRRKLGSNGGYICGYGTHHANAGGCSCMKSGKFPLTNFEASENIERLDRYLKLTDDERKEYDFQSDGAMANLLEDGYFQRIIEVYALPALPTPRQ